MRAWVLHDIGDIRYEETQTPVPASGEVRISVKAAGVCGSDIPRIFTTGAHRMPLIPGHEFSGVVEVIGDGVDSAWMGKRVGVFPLIPCGKCSPCLDKHPEMCRSYDYIGSRRDGAFAECVLAPVSNLIEIPETVSFEAAAMFEPMAVAVHAMRMALGDEKQDDSMNSNEDSKIVVCGLGTIGLLLVRFLLECGCKDVYVVGRKDGQKHRALILGIPEDHYCDGREVDVSSWIMGHIGGADVFFECVGKNECVSLGISCLTPGGTLITVGNPYSDMMFSRDTYWKILRNQLKIKGTWNSTFLKMGSGQEENDDWHYVLKRLAEGSVDPTVLITHRLWLEELYTGFTIMRDKTEDYCKVMMIGKTE